ADRRACSAEHAAASVRCGRLDTRLSAFCFPFFFRDLFRSVIAGHSRLKNGVTSFAYDPAIHAAVKA
ncbi:MAG: hypothetical protein WBD33_15755, partial [Xanthobacteraceae bacterium]